MARTGWAARVVVPVVVALLAVSCSSGGSSDAGDTKGGSSSTTSSTPKAPTGFVPAPLSWHGCDEGECATLVVPLDYRRPDGPTIDLAVARKVATDPRRRIGSLVLNPGGPGAAALSFPAYAASELPREITSRFDIVAWDPRGSGQSTHVDCGERLDYLFRPDSAPDDPTELTALEDAAHRFMNACVAKSGRLLRHISTDDTVRDLDTLRVALGEDRLNFLGLSYGTVIGGGYATAFPHQVRTMVLDGAVDPSLPIEDLVVQQAKGFDAGLAAFFAWCTKRTCSFARGSDPASAYAAIAATVDAHPLDAGRDLFGPTQFDIAAAALLYGGDLGYRTLAQGLHDVQRGSPGVLRNAYNEYVGRIGLTYDTEWPAFITISCADGPNLAVAGTEALQRRAAAEAPTFGASTVGLGYPCSYWPYPEAHHGPYRFSAAGAPPIVVVGTDGDPATPVAWASGLASQLAGSRLVTVTGSTHTSSLYGNQCLEALLTRYFVDRVPPANGSHCG